MIVLEILTLSLRHAIDTKIEYYSPVSADQFDTFK
jgi:hypothetical protein